jgi:hypothetical protein
MGHLFKSSILLLAALPMSAAAQEAPYDYAVKFVCGTRALGERPPLASVRNAVKPGVYNTAINLYNPSREGLRIRILLAGTDSAPVPGGLFPLLPAPTLTLAPERALEIDCDDILRSAERVLRRVAFLKGFARIASDGQLEVVAVYTAGPASQLATMDVEHVQPIKRADAPGAQACRLPDLAISEITGPAHLNQLTRTKVRVSNIGNAVASNIEVTLEDVTNTTAERKATAGIPTVAPGTDAVVALDHQYLVPQASWPSMVAQVDPKGMIEECREDNNRKEVGSP